MPIDFYIESPDNFGGFVRLYELPELIRVAAPVYVKFGLRNAPNLYPSGTHLEATAVALSRERVRRAQLALEMIGRSGLALETSVPGAPGLAVPVSLPSAPEDELVGSTVERIGFIGLGVMGRPMAHNLLRADADVVVHSRSPGPVDELVASGAARASTPSELAAIADVVITMLPDTPDVELVLFGEHGVRMGSVQGPS